MVSLQIGLIAACLAALGAGQYMHTDSYERHINIDNKLSPQQIMVTGLAGTTSTDTEFSPEQIISFNIPAQTASETLITFGKQANITVLLQHDAREIKLPELKGEYSIKEGLEHLLGNAGLLYRITDDSIIISNPAEAESRGQLKESARKKSGKDHFLAGVAAFFASTLTGASAPAAENDTGNSSATRIEEIVVTATRRAESLQNVPISITAMTAEDIKNTGSRNLRELADSVPNLLIPAGRSPVESDISIRGIFANVEFEFIGFDTTYSVYVDGVYQGNQSAANPDLMEIERVEILRGPQGTLFGKNTIAGAINIISKKPTNEFEGSVTAEYGNLDNRRLNGIINVPIIDNVLAVRAAFGAHWREGYVTNVTLNNDNLANINQRSGRFSVGYTPTEDLRAYLNVDVVDGNTNAYNMEAANAVQGDFRPYTIHSNVLEKGNLDKLGLALTVEWDLLDGYTLTSITGYRDDEAFFLKDVDETALDVLPFFFTGTQELWTQELRVNSPQEDRINYVAGLYYLNQDRSNFTRGVIGPDWIPPLAGSELFADATVENTSYSAFFNLNIDVTDRWRIFGGLRYTYDKKEMTIVQTSSPPTAQTALALLPGNIPIDDITDGEFTWSTGVQFDVTDDRMVYGSVSRGYKSGSYTGVAIISQAALLNIMVEPEFVTSYEVGAKTSWLDNRLQANLAFYYMDYTDLQVRSYDPTAGVGGTGAQIWSNAGEVTSKGFELEFKARPTEGLTLSGGVGYIDSTYGNFAGVALPRGPGNTVTGAPSLALDLNDGVIDGRTDASGNEVPLAPQWNLNLAAHNNYPLANGANWMSRIEYQYVAERYSADGVANFDFDELLPNYQLVNLRTGYESADGTWNVYAWAKNLFDENRLVENRFSSFGFPKKEQRFMEPRTYGVTVNYNF